MGRFHILALGMAPAVLALGLSSANATPADDACSHASPSAAVCVGADKLAERAAAECRRVGLPASDCNLPLGHQVGDDIVDAYRKSWVHRTAAFQYHLGDGIPLQKTKWLGTHNSFNSVSYPPTLSQTDSNQQLTLTQQLEIDMRSLELDVHWIHSVNANGQNAVVVCHARGPDQQNFGCTNERLLKQVLPEIAKWLNTPANRRQVILLYLEDELGDPAGYAQTVQVLDAGLKRADGSSLIYRPRQSQMTAKGCADLPLKISRNDIRRAGAQVVLVGNCRSGWASDVFSWDDVHVESGSTPHYRPFTACDATYSRHVYDTEIVRYYEDSTWLSSAIDPTGSPDAHAAESLTPSKVAMMTPCGVNLFGFDQLLPDDGRIAATIWSWAQDKPKPADGRCTVQRSDTRWITRPCGARRRAACSTRDGWRITRRKVTWAGARQACVDRNGTFSLPPTGYENERLRAVSPGEVWLAYRLP